MKLNVHVLDKRVGVLEQVGDFRSVMTYVPDVAPEELVVNLRLTKCRPPFEEFGTPLYVTQ
jgi:hypothetical protein